MMGPSAPSILKLLAHDVRWSLLSELAHSDRRVGELVALTTRPQNLVSYHLGLLRDGGIVREHRSSADGRDVYYSLELERVGDDLARSGVALHPALGRPFRPADEVDRARLAAVNPVRVLFLCTHNSARSQMAEAMLRAAAGDAVEVASAGSAPSGVHPLAARVMAERGIDLGQQQSKDMSEPASRRWNIVVTVCDRVREVCPAFPADTRVTHWSVRDPAAVGGSEAERLAAFRAAADEIGRRVGRMNYELGIRNW